jgi:hypothetical protein
MPVAPVPNQGVVYRQGRFKLADAHAVCFGRADQRLALQPGRLVADVCFIKARRPPGSKASIRADVARGGNMGRMGRGRSQIQKEGGTGSGMDKVDGLRRQYIGGIVGRL